MSTVSQVDGFRQQLARRSDAFLRGVDFACRALGPLLSDTNGGLVVQALQLACQAVRATRRARRRR